jgi:CHAD domain-containing protein
MHAKRTPAGQDSISEKARQILEGQLRLMESHASQALRFRRIRDVHDLRVAIRRFRVALRVFGRVMPSAPVARARIRLRDVNRRLGPVRDDQTWRALLIRIVGRRKKPITPPLKGCLNAAKSASALSLGSLDSILEGAPFIAARECCDRIACGSSARRPAGPFLAGKLRRAYERLAGSADVHPPGGGEALHAFRRRCRRVRYLSEFAEPLLDESVHKLSRHLRRVSASLGDLHDAEIRTRRLGTMADPPEELLLLMARKKQEARKECDAAWRRLTARHFRRRILEDLRTAKRAEGSS